MNGKINAVCLGRMEYGQVLSIQEKLQQERIKGEVKDTILIVEHPEVLTMGRRAKESNILVPKEILKEKGVDIYEVTRGGDVTYHGPGQIVGYPIMDLKGYGKDIKAFVWNIEEVFIRLLKKEYGIEANRDENKYTGVWVGNNKITAIGIAVKHWVTMHGFAYNVNTDLENFKWIIPCGLTDKGVTSLEKLLGNKVDFNDEIKKVLRYFCEVFGLEPVIISKEDFLERMRDYDAKAGMVEDKSKNGTKI